MRLFLRKVSYALTGIKTAFAEEKHIRIHVTVALLVIILGAIVSLHPIEWMIVLLTIGNIIALELINSGIERAVDFTGTEIHPLAKKAKDMSAGAVLIMSIIAVVIGIIIFMPKIIHLITL